MNVEAGLLVFEVGPVRAELRELAVRDDVEGMIEGTPRLHRRFRLIQFDQQLQAGDGLYIHDLDRIRADEAAAVDEWLPRHRAEARLTSYHLSDRIKGNGRTVLRVVWFQHCTDDPFAQLAEIVRPLDWDSLAAFEPDRDEEL